MRSRTKEIIGFKDYVYILFFMIIGVVCCTPRLNQGVFMALSVLLMSMIILSKVRYLGGRNISLTMCVLGFMFLIFIYRITNISNDAWGRYITYIFYNLQFLLLPLLATFKNKTRNYIWWGVLAIALVNVVYNIIIRVFIPEIGESRSFFEDEYLESINVGTSAFYTFSLFYFDVCFFLFLNTKERRIRMTMLFLSIIATVFIVWFCLKASVVVFYLMSVVLIVLTKGKNSGGRIWLLFIVSLLIYWLVSEFSNELVRFIVSNSPSERLTKRLVLLIDDQSMYASDSSYNARKDLWFMSLSTWLQSPANFLFGVGNHYSSGGNNYGIGQHSELLDLLAQYGLLGGVFASLILAKLLKAIKLYFNKKCHLQITMIFLIYIACGFTKYIFSPIVGCAMFLLLPLSSQFIEMKNSR